MRLTARALSVIALAGAAVGAAASAASADPAAEVSPGSVEPGGTVTISVTCDAISGSPPDFIDATSEGFEEGKVRLSRVEGDEQGVAGAAAYRGTARIPNVDDDPDAAGPESGAGPESEWGVDGACPGGSGGQEKKWRASYTVARGDTAASDTAQSLPDSGTVERLPDSDAVESLPESGTAQSLPESDAVESPLDSGTVQRSPDSDAAQNLPDSDAVERSPGSGTVQRSPDSDAAERQPDSGTVQRPSESGTGERPPTVQRGVDAGEGGAFTGSVPALVAGGVLIAGALGAAVHRLRHKDTSADR
ncbi:hypothetical protein [Streptomyces sp. NPDC001530]|uniref:hypothetical protein n=1 Tax=Streptomyces sp. NPDC001530 TaxID=3364582 RepID=UPI0036918F6D